MLIFINNYLLKRHSDIEKYENEVKDSWDWVIQKNIYDTRGFITKRVDAAGYLSATTDAARYGVEYAYDTGGRVTGITAPGAKERGRASKSYTYDAMGNVITLKDGEGNTTAYKRDLWGRATEIADALGIKSSYTFDNAGNVTSSHRRQRKYHNIHLQQPQQPGFNHRPDR